MGKAVSATRFQGYVMWLSSQHPALSASHSGPCTLKAILAALQRSRLDRRGDFLAAQSLERVLINSRNLWGQGLPQPTLAQQARGSPFYGKDLTAK
jgi:hypothetical protein